MTAIDGGFPWIDQSPAAVFVTDGEGRVSWANRTLARSLGVIDGGLVGLALQDLLSGAGRIHYESTVLPRLMLAGELQGLVIELCRADGTNLSLICATSPLHHVGEAKEFIWIGLDISDRREHEQALEVSQRRLSRLQRLASALLPATSGTEVAAVVLNELVDGVKADHGVIIGFSRSRAPMILGERTAIAVSPLLSRAFDDLDALAATTVPRYDGAVGAVPVQTAVLPLIGQLGHNGTLAIAIARQRPFDEAEKLLLRAATEMAAHALDRAELQRREDLELQRTAFISQVVHNLETVSTVADRAQLVADLLVPDYADYVTIELLDKGPAPTGLRHRDPELEPTLRALRSAVAIGTDEPHSLAAGREARQPTLLEDVDEGLYASFGLGATEEAMLQQLSPQSYLGVPLVTRDDNVLGSIMLIHGSSGRRYQEDDARYFTRVADAIALSLENARLYEEQAAAARDLQLGLLPPTLPLDPRVELHGFYEPSSEMAMVGGDWYDAFFLDDDRLGLVVGDVVGGGIQAAATMGQLKVAVRAYALEGHDVGTTLELLELFVDRLPDARYSTLCYAVVDLATSTISYGCAGHPPPILIPAGGAAVLMNDGRQRLLGCNDRPPIVARCQAAPGDSVLLYSDGLVERRGSTITDGIDSLLSLVDENRYLIRDLRALAARLDAEKHDDDTTALSVTFT